LDVIAVAARALIALREPFFRVPFPAIGAIDIHYSVLRKVKRGKRKGDADRIAEVIHAEHGIRHGVQHPEPIIIPDKGAHLNILLSTSFQL
jgi:hypothetical protein